MTEQQELNKTMLLHIKDTMEELREQMKLEHKNNLRNIALFKAVFGEMREADPGLEERVRMHLNNVLLMLADDDVQGAAIKQALDIVSK